MSNAVATSRARATADPAAGTILATVEIAAPAERVFNALTDPRELMVWWGSPETYRAHAWESDLRVGGRWRVEGKGANGEPYWVSGEFVEIAPPRKLVHTWLPGWEAGHPATTVAFTIDDIPGGTRVTLRHDGFAERRESCEGHAHGWERVLGWLTRHLEATAEQGAR